MRQKLTIGHGGMLAPDQFMRALLIARAKRLRFSTICRRKTRGAGHLGLADAFGQPAVDLR